MRFQVELRFIVSPFFTTFPRLIKYRHGVNKGFGLNFMFFYFEILKVNYIN